MGVCWHMFAMAPHSYQRREDLGRLLSSGARRLRVGFAPGLPACGRTPKCERFLLGQPGRQRFANCTFSLGMGVPGYMRSHTFLSAP
jgi:hypothetical protein